MKLCIFCNSTHSSKTICKAKQVSMISKPKDSKPPFNPFSGYSFSIPQVSTNFTSYNSEAQSQPFQQAKIAAANKFTHSYSLSDSDSALFKTSLNFLLQIQSLKQKILGHSCSSSCFIKTLKSSIESSSLLYEDLYTDLCSFLSKPINLLTIANTIEIILMLLHRIYLQENNDQDCNFKCIAHECFGISISDRITCDCKNSRIIKWRGDNFIYPAYISSNPLDYSSEIFTSVNSLKYCQSSTCYIKSSKKFTILSQTRGHLLIELTVSRPASTLDLGKFSLIRNLENGSFYHLTNFIAAEPTTNYIVSHQEGKWTIDSLNFEASTFRTLADFLHRCNLVPLIMLYVRK